MKIKKHGKIKARILKSLRNAIYRLENKGNANFEKNGEKYFIREFLDYCKEKPVVVFDVGANIGKYSKAVSELAKKKNIPYKLHLFEPVKSCFNELKSKFSSDKDIIINNFGVSDTEKNATIYSDKDKSGLTSLYKRNLASYGIKMDREETVSISRLDGYIKNRGVKKIHLLKIDIEGNELKAFEGVGEFLKPKYIDFIQFEYGGCNLDSHTTLFELYEILTKNGFQVCRMMPNFLELKTYAKHMDDYVYSNYVAINPEILNNI